MQLVNSDVATICTGLAASMGAVLLTAAPRANVRAAHLAVMIHQPLGGAVDRRSDIEITAREIMKTKRELYEILSATRASRSRRSRRTPTATTGSRPREARNYGLIDEVLSKRGK